MVSSASAPLVTKTPYELQIELERSLSEDELCRLAEGLKLLKLEPPIELKSLSQDEANTLYISFDGPRPEGFGIVWWLIPALLALIPVGAVTWKLFSWEPEEMFPTLIKYLLPLAAVGIGAYLIIRKL